jgi:DNA-binding PadR family transcriptional regulator
MNDIAQITEDQITEIAAEMDTDLEATEAEATEAEATEAEATEAAPKKRPGKATTFSDNAKLISTLKIIDSADGEYHYKTGSVSRVLTLQLVEMGLVEAVDLPREGRGRPMKVYRLTSAGNTMVDDDEAGGNAELADVGNTETADEAESSEAMIVAEESQETNAEMA